MNTKLVLRVTCLFSTDDEGENEKEKPEADEKMETDGEKSGDESNKSNSDKGMLIEHTKF